MSARTESAPPTTENACSLPATASATAFVPSAKRGHSNTPIGPFQKIVFASASFAANAVARLGADVEPEPAVGDVVDGEDARLGVGLERGRARRRPSGSSTSKSSGFSTRSCSAILPPMSTVSASPAEVLEHAELVVDLRAAGDEHERPLDLAEQLAEMLELLLEQQAGVGGQQLGDAPRSTSARDGRSRTRR